MAEKRVSKASARQEEKEGNLMPAVLQYIQLDDRASLRRIASKVVDLYGTISCIGFAMDKFSRLEKGSEEEESTIAYIKGLAEIEIKSNKHLAKMLHEDYAHSDGYY
jgi:hypothetical protein